MDSRCKANPKLNIYSILAWRVNEEAISKSLFSQRACVLRQKRHRRIIKVHRTGSRWEGLQTPVQVSLQCLPHLNVTASENSWLDGTKSRRTTAWLQLHTECLWCCYSLTLWFIYLIKCHLIRGRVHCPTVQVQYVGMRAVVSELECGNFAHV